MARLFPFIRGEQKAAPMHGRRSLIVLARCYFFPAQTSLLRVVA
jgi:hypothetical protein